MAGEHRYPVAIAVVFAIALQIRLPDAVSRGLGPRALVPALEGALLLVVVAINPGRITPESARLRGLGITLTAVINAANLVSLVELLHALLYTPRLANGRALILASVLIWLTNVIVFGLWYWELDAGGPAERLLENNEPDFLFPQDVMARERNWRPHFVDYLYISFTNATAFSPTDTMPLSHLAKALMMLQSLASLLTVALVVSRAVNILS